MPFSDLDVRVIPNGHYIILQPFRWTHKGMNAITVPKGFKTDFASIPQGFRWLITGHDSTRKPAVVHDYLYRRGIGTKADADLVFRAGLKETGTPWWKVQACYYAVKFFGSGNFKEK
jgi:hypothetical protein